MENDRSQSLPDIRQTLVLNAPIRKVWDAVATSEGIAAWFMPNDFQPVAGFEFHLEAGPFGKSPCKVTEIDPPNKLSFRWGADWTLTFELIDLDGKTEFTLIHSGWDADKVTEFGETHTLVRDRMNNGWAGLQQSLRKYVEA
ncbi:MULTISPECIES: SRPBCC family protein [Paenibacillus]|mgnify:CR=1 FL=1|uniref:SRPBCC domain-containing protein n=1 Tax=Paenibacillus validus TaxID=44253 RepID=A0A7X2Z8G8_9BACL|nr:MULTISPECIES: SRPBCC domain-containing protein [Paenibacillus]MUG69680.1 SRPBCC domain-containing protein [Paenibacillus validus]